MAKIAIVGSGVVGTATGKGFARMGHGVSFVDIDQNRVQMLRAEGFDAGAELALSEEPTFVFLTLPTPNDGYRWDLGPMASGARSVGRALRDSAGFHTVVVRSTVPPGTCERLVQPLLEEVTGRRLGEGFALASNPEFLRARCAAEDFLHPWVTVVASRSPRTRELLQELLGPFGGQLQRLEDPALAELIKCVHNLFNAAKISFWNEIWQVSRHLNLDADVVAETVARSAEGSFNHEYGIWGGRPYGGACLPKDTKGFLGFATEQGLELPLASAVDLVNERMHELAAAGRGEQRELVVDLREERARRTPIATSSN
jgi:UDPglucose 6-dehydrogenase